MSSNAFGHQCSTNHVSREETSIEQMKVKIFLGSGDRCRWSNLGLPLNFLKWDAPRFAALMPGNERKPLRSQSPGFYDVSDSLGDSELHVAMEAALAIRQAILFVAEIDSNVEVAAKALVKFFPHMTAREECWLTSSLLSHVGKWGLATMVFVHLPCSPLRSTNYQHPQLPCIKAYGAPKVCAQCWFLPAHEAQRGWSSHRF